MSKIIRRIHSVLFWFVCGIILLIGWLVAPLIAFIFRLNELEVYHRGAIIWAKVLVTIGGIKLKVDGIENIPLNRPLIFASNHQSYIDIFILLSILPLRFCFVAWEELFRIRFLGTYMQKAGYIPISDNNTREAYKTILNAVDLVKSGESIVIFPEGKLSQDESLNPFGWGTSALALNSKTPVVPIAIRGSFNVLPKGKWILKPNAVKIKIGKPLNFSYYSKLNKKAYLETTEKINSSIKYMFSQMV